MSDPVSSKSQKYADTVNKTLAKTGGDAGETMPQVIPPGAESLVARVHPDALQKMFHDDIKSGGFEAAPEIFGLEEGMVISGILEGNGPVAEFPDPHTGEVKEVQTWILADATGAVRISILSSTQLDKKLNGFIGHFVKIARGRDRNIGNGKRMTEYKVWGPKLPGGARRQWFDIPASERAQILDMEQRRALPAGDHGGGNSAS
jgi:hypothetical protein